MVVAIPAYNAEPFIQAAVTSALEQHPEIRVLVADNASSDNTVGRIEELNSDRVRVHRQATNIGPHANGNWLLDNCDGDVVALLCADDVMLPGHLGNQLEILVADSAVRLVGCNMIETSQDLVPRRPLRTALGRWRGPDLSNLSVNTLRNLFGGPSNFVFRRRDLGSVRIDSRWSWLSDLDFASRLVGEGWFMNPGHFGYLYRRHPTSDSARLNAADSFLQDREWTEYFLENGGSAPRAIRALRGRVQDDLLLDRLSKEWNQFSRLRRSTCGPATLDRAIARVATRGIAGKAPELLT